MVVVCTPGFPYRFQVKLIDFGLSSVAVVKSDQEEPSSVDWNGNATNSAPEATHHHPPLDAGRDAITRSADIWSLGCILLSLAGWVADGEAALETFRQLRKDELARYPLIQGSAYTQSFHNGADVLQTVQDFSSLYKNTLGVYNVDRITPKIIDLVRNSMLKKHPRDRLCVKQVWSEMKNILTENATGSESDNIKSPIQPPRAVIKPKNRENTAQAEAQDPQVSLLSLHEPKETDSGAVKDASDRMSPSIFQTMSKSQSPVETSTQGSRQSSGTTGPPAYLLSQEQLAKYIDQNEKGLPKDLAVHAVIEAMKRNLGRRDYLIFIDNSLTMGEHRDEVELYFRNLAFIAKRLDGNEVELFLASNPTVSHKSKKTRELTKILQKSTYDHDPQMMETCLDEFADVIHKRLSPSLGRNILNGFQQKPLSIFVCTDGRWAKDEDKAAGVQRPVQRLAEKVQQLKLGRTRVMLQFLRFGDDENGCRYLKYLDDMGEENGL
jgi:serine/threonine protein kinase